MGVGRKEFERSKKTAIVLNQRDISCCKISSSSIQLQFVSRLTIHPLSTELPLLNVMLTGSGGTLTEGQNHALTCTASGGGSMAYNYIWLRNGTVVPGQNSSTYSFSPLLVADSGQYSCQVTVGSMTMNISGVVSITVVGESVVIGKKFVLQ